uniref:Putative ovule protein n=1 Tax=Solanum chacoense TaxID=4108 RepID=A0A0V0HSC7_SOLCH
MSPFLFAIAMEYLSRSLNGLKEDKTFKFHPKCSKLGITHLCFADDLLIFSRGDMESIKALQKCFSTFSQASGLQANLNKSSIYFEGVATRDKQQVIQ